MDGPAGDDQNSAIASGTLERSRVSGSDVPGLAPAGTAPVSGLIENGPSPVGSWPPMSGSTVITTIERPSARFTGGTTPAGSRATKSSPGNGGPGFGPENGLARSDPVGLANRPVDSGVPCVTPQPSNP